MTVLEQVIRKYRFLVYKKEIGYITRQNVGKSLETSFRNDTYKSNFITNIIQDIGFENYSDLLSNGMSKDKALKKLDKPKMGGLIGYVLNHKNLSDKEKIFKGIVFRNGYVDQKGGHETKDIPFTTGQINRDYDADVVPQDKVLGKGLAAISQNKEPDGIDKLFMLLSTSLSNENYEVFGIISGKTTIGKSALMNILHKIVGHDNSEHGKTKAIFGESGDTRFALRNISCKTLITLDEFPEIVSQQGTNTIKTIANKGSIAIESKQSNDSSTDNIGTGLSTTNYIPKFSNPDEPLKMRTVYFEFSGEYGDITTEDGDYIFNNLEEIIIPELLVYLVEAFVELQGVKTGRATKFMTKDTTMFGDQVEQEDVLIQGLNRNIVAVHGATTEQVGRLYMEEKKKDISLYKVSANTMGKKIKSLNIFKKKTKLKDGTRKNLYDAEKYLEKLEREME